MIIGLTTAVLWAIITIPLSLLLYFVFKLIYDKVYYYIKAKRVKRMVKKYDNPETKKLLSELSESLEQYSKDLEL